MVIADSHFSGTGSCHFPVFSLFLLCNFFFSSCPSADKWINRRYYIHIYSAIKRNEVLTNAATWMVLENIMLVKEASHKGHVLYDSV